jgi:hypothetical protein
VSARSASTSARAVLHLDEEQARDTVADDRIDDRFQLECVALELIDALAQQLHGAVGGNTPMSASPASNLGYSLVVVPRSSLNQSVTSERPASVMVYTVRSGRLPSRSISCGSINPRRAKPSTTE